MNILYVMIPLSLALVVFAGWGFFWAVGSGQFDDLDSPGWDTLREDSTVVIEEFVAVTSSQTAPSSVESQILNPDSAKVRRG